jgi:CheY-like chemotaxis protein
MNTAEDRSRIILVVEGDPLVRMLAWDILTEDAGCRVIEAVNADEALILLESRHDIRLVFADVNMPRSLNGFALARIVNMRFPGIKVIVTSGQARCGRPLPKGKRFLPKPYASSALIAMCRRCSARRHSRSWRRPTPPRSSRVLRLSPRPSRSVRSVPGIGAVGGLAQPRLEPEE